MYDRKTLLSLAVCLSSRRYSNSDKTSGISKGFGDRIAAGMVCSMSVSRESTPIAVSISAVSTAFGPMCRS